MAAGRALATLSYHWLLVYRVEPSSLRWFWPYFSCSTSHARPLGVYTSYKTLVRSSKCIINPHSLSHTHTSHSEEVEYRHRRFQGLSLEQQRQARANRKKKKRVTERRESGVSGNFNPVISRSPSQLSSAARPNPFALQVYYNANIYHRPILAE